MDLYSCDKISKCKKYYEGKCPIQDKELAPFCMKFFKINELQNYALLTDSQKLHRDLRLDKDGTDRDKFNRLKEIEKNIVSFVEKGKNLYIYSTIPGNGKSSWSLRLLNAYFNCIWYSSELKCKGLFINVPRFLLNLKDNISQKIEEIQYIKDNILNADVVIWDDIGTKGFTPFEMENILSMVNARLDLGKANIYTSNLDSETLKQTVGDRLFSRIYNMSEVIEFKGMDKRGLF